MITIDQVKDDIRSGKSTRIYYSTASFWWTHLDADLEDSTAMGKLAQSNKRDAIMASMTVPKDEKDRMAKLFAGLETMHQIPLDPDGCPLMQTDKPLGWVEAAEQQSDHFGKHGLAAFIKTHHQNHDGQPFRTWPEVNSWIDINIFTP
jgi:hypothetical protein